MRNTMQMLLTESPSALVKPFQVNLPVQTVYDGREEHHYGDEADEALELFL